jgi:hypothetical protein
MKAINYSKHIKLAVIKEIFNKRKRLSIAIGVLVFVLIPAVIITLKFARPTVAAWWDETWMYRKAINIPSHSTSENNVYVTVPEFDATDTSRFQPDCGDLRFTKENGELLPYYVVDCDATATIHVQFDTLPAGASTYYMYYGNLSAPNGFSSSDFSTAATGLGTQTFASEELSPAPVAYWKFDEGQGTQVNDSTSNKNVGIMTSGVSWQTPDQCISGKCLFFEGTSVDSRVDVVSNSTTKLQNTLTIQTWIRGDLNSQGAENIYPLAKSNAFALMSSTSSKTATTGINMYGTPANYLCYISTNHLDNKWHFLAATYDSSIPEANVYLDGKLIKTCTTGVPTLLNDSTDPNIGTWSNTYGNFRGFLDEAKIYPYVRTPAQIKSDYNSRGSTKGVSTQLGASNQNLDAFSNGLVGYWKMDEISGNISDSSGNGNTGTPNGTTVITGKFSNGREFNGTSDYIDTGTNSILNIPGSVTQTAWIKVSSLPSSTSAIVRWGGQTNVSMRLTPAGKLDHNYYDNSGTWRTLVDPGSLSVGTDQWTFIAIVRDIATNEVRYYYNGQYSSKQTLPNPPSSTITANFLLGAASSTQYFNGQIDEARIYNRALSTGEVADLYNWAPGPIAYYNFEEGGGSSLYDTTGNNLDLSWQGTPAWGIGKYGNGGVFGGSNYARKTSALALQQQSITAEAWVFPTETRTEGIITYYNYAGSYAYSYFLDYTSANKFNFVSQVANTGGKFSLTTSKTYALNTWHHVAAQFDSGVVKLFVDGVQDGQTTYSGNIDYSGGQNQFWIGKENAWMKGSIDEVRIYNYARTPKQIVEDMNAGHPAPGSPIGSAIGYWKFDEGNSTLAYNSGIGDNINATITGASWNNGGKYGKAISLNGTSDYAYTADSPSLDMGKMTVSAWIKTTNSSEQCIVERNNSTFYFCTNGGKLRYWVSGVAATWTASNKSINDGGWHHVLATWDGVNKKLYIDGVLDITEAGTGGDMGSGSYGLNIGVRINSGVPNYYFNGLIDEVKLYSYALTSDEVKLDYNQGKSMVLGSVSTDSSGNPDNSYSAKYCIPGDSTSCGSPVGEWKLDEKTGGYANDTSGNGNTGTLQNTPTWTNGKEGAALSFDGSDFISTTLDIYDLYNAGGFTIEAWSYHTVAGTYDTIASSFKGSPYEGIFLRTGVNGATMDCSMANAGSFNTASAPNEQNTWIHWVCTYSGGVMKLYKNGVYQSQDATASMSDAGNTLLIGADYAGSENWAGKLDQVRVFDYARTPAQIAYDYNHGAPVAWWKFDECQGTTAYDSSGNGNSGTITIGATIPQTTTGTCTTPTDGSGAWYNGHEGKFNSSLKFDGADDYITSSANWSNKFSNGITLSAWVKFPNTTNYWRSITIENAANTEYDVWIQAQISSGVVQFGSGGAGHYKNGSTNVSDNSWHHIVGVTDYTSGGTKIYVDGKEDGGTVSGTPSYTATKGPLDIGKLMAGGSPYYANGQIDDVRVYNYALTDEQIKTLYNSGTVNYSPTVGSP